MLTKDAGVARQLLEFNYERCKYLYGCYLALEDGEVIPERALRQNLCEGMLTELRLMVEVDREEIPINSVGSHGLN